MFLNVLHLRLLLFGVFLKDGQPIAYDKSSVEKVSLIKPRWFFLIGNVFFAIGYQ